MKLYFALQCHNFQRRLCWELSSIVQQTCSPFDIIIDIACLKNNGDPTTETVADKFNHIGLDVRLTVIDDEFIFAHRGLVRNIQIENALNCNRNYIWFADADHVYHPDTFNQLICWLKTYGSKTHSCVFSRLKNHTDVEQTDKMINECIDELPYIANAYYRSMQLNTIEHIDKNQMAPGNMQIVSMSDIIKLAGSEYIDPDNCKDKNMLKKGQRAWSDMDFRKKIGRSKAIDLPLQIHLNHIRDKDIGCHTEVQR